MKQIRLNNLRKGHELTLNENPSCRCVMAVINRILHPNLWLRLKPRRFSAAVVTLNYELDSSCLADGQSAFALIIKTHFLGSFWTKREFIHRYTGYRKVLMLTNQLPYGALFDLDTIAYRTHISSYYYFSFINRPSFWRPANIKPVIYPITCLFDR